VQQAVSAPTTAEVVEQRALRESEVEPLQKTQQRVARRDAAIDAVVADRGAQIVVEQRWERR
jgi:hypothetical protein